MVKGELYSNWGGIQLGKRFMNNCDKDRIKEMYSNGVTIKEIEKRLGYKYTFESIKSYVRRNLKMLREKHAMEYKHKEEVIRKTRLECSREMSKGSFVKQNSSIYMNNKNGDLVVNKNVAPIISFDTPKRLTRKEVLGF